MTRREKMLAMDAATRHELQMLRARAYGPSADIDRDARAAQRLRELEGLDESPADEGIPLAESSIPDAAPTPSESRADRARRPEPTPLSAGEDAEAPAVTTPSSDPEVAGPRRAPRWTKVWWVLSVVVAGTVAAAATFALTSLTPVQASHGAPQIATLERSAVIDIPTGWFGAGPSSAGFEFYGMTFFETTGGYGTAGSDCFSAISTEDLPEPDADPNSWSFQGMTYTGCRVGSFPATIQMTVNSSVPEELRAQFTDGSGLQFVFDGERIGVFLDDAAGEA